jgi:hypothetical protein
MIGVLVSAQNTVCAAIYKFSSWLLLVFPMQLNPRFIERSAACNDVVWLSFSQKMIMDWAYGLVFSKQLCKTGMFGVVCDSSRTSSLSDYKFPTRIVDAFLLTQPTLTLIQKYYLALACGAPLLLQD